MLTILRPWTRTIIVAVASIWCLYLVPVASAVTTAQKIAILDASINSYSYFWDTAYPHRTVSPYNAMNWNTDFCSNSPDVLVGVWNFRPACRRHDFGYRNACALGVFSTRKANIDSQFYADLVRICYLTAGTNTLCYQAAAVYKWAVSHFGSC